MRRVELVGLVGIWNMQVEPQVHTRTLVEIIHEVNQDDDLEDEEEAGGDAGEVLVAEEELVGNEEGADDKDEEGDDLHAPQPGVHSRGAEGGEADRAEEREEAEGQAVDRVVTDTFRLRRSDLRRPCNGVHHRIPRRRVRDRRDGERLDLGQVARVVGVEGLRGHAHGPEVDRDGGERREEHDAPIHLLRTATLAFAAERRAGRAAARETGAQRT